MKDPIAQLNKKVNCFLKLNQLVARNRRLKKMKTRTYTWGNRKFQFYDPKINNSKRLGVLGFVALCLVTPATNWMLVPARKILLNNLIWMYK